MAIRLKTQRTERVLFCGSKWWGDPDLPENMQYPTISVEEDGEKYDYPLTFICQINCEDLAPFDHQDKLPHEGMLYFFGAVDQLIGYESPIPTPIGEWPKGHLVVKYAKSINFETFQSCILVDDDGNSLTDPELEICFEECEDEADGIKILGVAADVRLVVVEEVDAFLFLQSIALAVVQKFLLTLETNLLGQFQRLFVLLSLDGCTGRCQKIQRQTFLLANGRAVVPIIPHLILQI